MTWSKFDDGYDEHEKIENAWFAFPPNPVGLHVMAITHCSRKQSDGVISPRWLTRMIPQAAPRKRILDTMLKDRLLDFLPAGDAVELKPQLGAAVTVGPFADDRYIVHNFLHFNPSSSYTEQEREWDRRRKSLFADKELVAAIRERDQDRCRYCGVMVNWRDRRGEAGATYDHVIPRGDNTLDNIVVACRGCNLSKGARTPAQAGKVLLEPGQLGPESQSTSSQVRLRSVQDTRPDPTRPDQEAPQPPKGGRKRDRDTFSEEMGTWAGEHFPGAHPSKVAALAAQVRARAGQAATVETMNEYARRHPVWNPYPGEEIA